MDLPPARYSNPRNSESRDALPSYLSTTGSAHYSEPTQPQASKMMLGDVAFSGTAPIFGGDGDLSKSPYAGMPEDFMAFLFNSPPGDGSPMTTTSLPHQYFK